MQQDQIGYTTELDSLYVSALKGVVDEQSFGLFLIEWRYWLDADVKKLKGESWGQIAPLIKDCSTEGVVPEDKHDQAIALLMPEKIFRVSIEAHRFGVPWGCAYLRLKEMKRIKY